jgi:hypothetical protein
MASYSPGGYLGRLSDLMASFSAHPAFELPSPFAWGDEDEVRRRFAAHSTSIEVRHRTLYFGSLSVASFLEFWETTNAPLAALKSMLPPERYQQVLTQMAQLVEEQNQSRYGNVKVGSPYVLALARKPD